MRSIIRFFAHALEKWKSGKVEMWKGAGGKVEKWKRSVTHFSTIQLFHYFTCAKRVGHTWVLKSVTEGLGHEAMHRNEIGV